MKPLSLLLLGVVVGWAASGVDWSREAVGEDVDTVSGKKVLQYDGPAPLAEGRKVVLQQVTDEKGVKHVVPHEAIDSPIYQSGRYSLKVQASNAYYVIDSLTGRVWYGSGANRPQLIAAELPEK